MSLCVISRALPPLASISHSSPMCLSSSSGVGARPTTRSEPSRENRYDMTDEGPDVTAVSTPDATDTRQSWRALTFSSSA